MFSSIVSCKASPRSSNFNPSVEVADITTGPVPSIGTMLSGTRRPAEDLYNKFELKYKKLYKTHYNSITNLMALSWQETIHWSFDKVLSDFTGKGMSILCTIWLLTSTQSSSVLCTQNHTAIYMTLRIHQLYIANSKTIFHQQVCIPSFLIQNYQIVTGKSSTYAKRLRFLQYKNMQLRSYMDYVHWKVQSTPVGYFFL